MRSNRSIYCLGPVCVLPSSGPTVNAAAVLLQAMLCNRTRSAAACKALSFCRSASKGTCIPRLYTADNFGSSVQEYMVRESALHL